jgi:hypothetical protein
MFAGLPVVIFGIELPALAFLIAAGFWFVLSVYLLLREQGHLLPAIFSKAFASFARGCTLCFAVVAVMAVIVFPSVLLAIALPSLFSVLVLGGLFALLIFYLFKKYRSMSAADASETRQRLHDTRPPLCMRYLFRVLVRPCLIALLALAYAYLLVLFLHAQVLGGLGLIFLTLSAMLGARLLRRTAYVAGSV